VAQADLKESPLTSRTFQVQDVLVSPAQSEAPLSNPLRPTPNDPSRLVPLYTASGSLIGHFDEEDLKRMAGVELRVNKRGHIKRARVIPLVCVVDISHGWKGRCKVQTFLSGHWCYTLRGTPGSESDEELIDRKRDGRD
jgi:hypothetical protein